MEGVQLPLLLRMKGPGLTAVQECAQDTGSIDLKLWLKALRFKGLQIPFADILVPQLWSPSGTISLH